MRERRVHRTHAWTRRPTPDTRRSHRGVSAALFVAASLLLAACGQQGTSDTAGEHRASHQTLGRRAGIAEGSDLPRKISSIVSLLQHPPPLDRGDRLRIQRALPASLPFLPERTARVPARGLVGRYWIAPGVVGIAHSPGVCLYAQMPQARPIGVSCFDLTTVASGRAVMLYWIASGADAIGIVPSDTATIAISGRQAWKRLRAARNIYAAHLDFKPSRVVVRWPHGTAEIKLSGGPPAPPH